MSMISKYIERIEVLRAIQEKRIKQNVGAQILNISTRQVRYLMKRFIEEGPKGVISRKVGVPSNNRMSQGAVNQTILYFSEPFT